MVYLFGLFPDKTVIQKDNTTPMFTEVLLTTAKTWEQLKGPLTDKRIKMWYIYTMEYYSAIKKNKIMPLGTTQMNPEIIILSEVSKIEEDQYHMISLICGL